MRKPDDFPAAGVTAWARLLRVGQAMLAAADAELRAKGFPPLAWYDALLELKRAGSAGLRPYELQREMLLAQYNVSRLIDRLVAAGYVERRTASADRRGQVLTITPTGMAMLTEMWPAYRSIIRTAFGDRLDDGEFAVLNDILAKLGSAPAD